MVSRDQANFERMAPMTSSDCPLAVDFGVVEEIDARVVGCLEARLGDGVSNLLAEGHPGAKR